MQRRALALATVLGFGLSSALPLAGGAQQAASGYTVPRTEWGDPDLTGKWPSTDMVGVPMPVSYTHLTLPTNREV